MKSLEFNGTGTEYFKIWIVNILLTIITLGIYYPWAKVRSRRYFYGNTELDNANFEYHATGKQLFLSYLIAMVLFISFSVLGEFIPPIFSVILAFTFVFAIPWIIWRSLKFNLRMSSYRNVRFGFGGSAGGAYATFLGYPIGLLLGFVIVLAIVVGIIGKLLEMEIAAGLIGGIMLLFFYPAYFAMMNKISNSYFINGAEFGQGKFSASFEFNTFFKIALKAMGLGLLLSILALIIVGISTMLIPGFDLSSLQEQMQVMQEGAEPDALIIILLLSVYALLILVSFYIAAYIKARQRTYVFSQTLFDNAVQFESTLRANTFFAISLSNILMLIFTLGLAYPWAKIRLYRYSIESINVGAPGGLAGYMTKAGNESALGEELGDAFDIDIGGIAF